MIIGKISVCVLDTLIAMRMRSSLGNRTMRLFLEMSEHEVRTVHEASAMCCDLKFA